MRPAPNDRRRSVASLVAALAVAGSVAAAGLPSGEPALLLPDQAFRFSARALDANTLEARFDVADGYYLYRDKIALAVEPADAGVVKPDLPPGSRKRDEFFGDVETYRGRLVVRMPLAGGQAGQTLVLRADSQGCADAGVCYPPTVRQVRLTLPAPGEGPGPVVEGVRKRGLFD